MKPKRPIKPFNEPKGDDLKPTLIWAFAIVVSSIIISCAIRPELIEWIIGIAAVIIAWIDGNIL